MSKPVATALTRLSKIRREKAEVERRESEAIEDAAKEYGRLVLAAGGDELDPDQVRRIIVAAVRIGPDETLKLLSAKAEKGVPAAPISATAEGGGSHADAA
jgi:2-keto-3-deoxy-6-phosphogluconate aldolase